MSAWTPEQDAELHRLWKVEGLSASLCAKQFPGRTRNAIIGRVFRMGWCRPEASAPNMRAAYPKRVANVARRHQQPAPAFRAGKWKDGNVQAPTPAVLPTGDIESPNAKPWTERKARECAFPVSGEGADVVSCCNPAEATYCASHFAIMTVPGSVSKRPYEPSAKAYGDRSSMPWVAIKDDPISVDVVVDPSHPHRRDGALKRKPRTFEEWAA